MKLTCGFLNTRWFFQQTKSEVRMSIYHKVFDHFQYLQYINLARLEHINCTCMSLYGNEQETSKKTKPFLEYFFRYEA